MNLLLKKFLSFLFIIMLAFTRVSLAKPGSPDQELANSLLWKIEKEGVHTSYLYGTLHVLKQEDFILNEHVKNAFSAAEQLVLEIDMDDPGIATAMMEDVHMKDGVTIESLIGAEDFKQLDEYLKASHNSSGEQLNSWMPYLVAGMLYEKVVGSKPASYEGTFLQMAMNSKLEVLGLETIGEQLEAFHSYAYEKQADVLSTYLNKPTILHKEFMELISLYQSEDLKEIQKYTVSYLASKGMNPEIFLNKRNHNWVPKIGAYTKDKATFFAVGAAHLGGEEGVLALLKTNGYTVTAVKAIH